MSEYYIKIGDLHLEPVTDGRLSYFKFGYRVMVGGKFGGIPVPEYAKLQTVCETLFGPEYGEVVRKRVHYYALKPNKKWQGNSRNIFFNDINDATTALSHCNFG